MYSNTLYSKRLHVLSSMVQSNCLGERVPSSLTLPIWCYWVRWFVNQNVYSFHRLSAILQVEYGGIDMMQDLMENFNHCARHYATNKGKSRTAAGQSCLSGCMCGCCNNMWVARLIGFTDTWYVSPFSGLHSPRASWTGEGRTKRSKFHQGSTNKDAKSA